MLRPPPTAQSAVPAKEKLNVKAMSEPVGFGTIRVSGELYGDDGSGRSALLRISKCRLVPHQSGIQQQDEDERHPMLRVLWKPDITKLRPSNGVEFLSYIEQYVAIAATAGERGVSMARLGAVVDLLAHKNPKLRILSFLADEKDESYLADTLRLATAFKRCQSLWRASYAEDGTLRFQNYSSNGKPAQSIDREEPGFDVILLGPKNTT
jgi:hypothetical protein